MNRRDGGDGGRDLKRPRHGYDPNGRGRAPPRHYTRQGGFGGARGPAKLGWRVISVSHFDWDGRDGWTREAHLREHVLAATSMGLAPQN